MKLRPKVFAVLSIKEFFGLLVFLAIIAGTGYLFYFGFTHSLSKEEAKEAEEYYMFKTLIDSYNRR